MFMGRLTQSTRELRITPKDVEKGNTTQQNDKPTHLKPQRKNWLTLVGFEPMTLCFVSDATN